jgi:hypothetical protein
MRRKLVFLLSILFLLTHNAFALILPPKVTMSEAIRQLQMENYQVENDMQLAGKAYHAIVINSSGQRYAVSVNADTDKLTFTALNPIKVDIYAAAQIIERQGFIIHRIEDRGNVYIVDAIDRNGNQKVFDVDKVDGSIRKHIL